MKLIYLILITVFIMFNSIDGMAQANDKFKEISIQTSAQCEMCKTKIEETLAFEKGVKSSELDLRSKIVKVVFNPGKTNPSKIRNAISKSGYDADDIKADPEAYKKLPACCKKPDEKGP
jgi:mercuric ion binding protein